jgi:hypothetical protein
VLPALLAAPQQLPHFFSTEQEEQQQLVVACQRILVSGAARHLVEI